MNAQPRLSRGLSPLSLKFPGEHGAVVVFSMSCIISLLMFRENPLILACSLLALWAIILSLHRPMQLFGVALCSVVILQVIAGAAVALWVAAVWLGCLITRSSFCRKHFWWKESFGLAGACLAPLVVSFLLGGDPGLHATVAATLLAAILTGTALIRVCHKETRVTPVPSFLLAIALWLFLAKEEPIVAGLSLLPYVIHSAWIMERPSAPTFKELGRSQSLCLLWVAVVIVLHIFGKI